MVMQRPHAVNTNEKYSHIKRKSVQINTVAQTLAPNLCNSVIDVDAVDEGDQRVNSMRPVHTAKDGDTAPPLPVRHSTQEPGTPLDPATLEHSASFDMAVNWGAEQPESAALAYLRAYVAVASTFPHPR
jgi:hypothetical protein